MVEKSQKDGTMKNRIAITAGAAIITALVMNGTSYAATGYKNPNGPHWHCQQYRNLYSWNCLSGHGFIYGGVWGYTRDFYQHPHPNADYVVNEPYFTSRDNGLKNVPQYMRRVVIVEDGQMNELIEPVNWNASENITNPVPPVTCMVLTGPNTGKQFRCSSLDVRSVLDYWRQAQVITNPW